MNLLHLAHSWASRLARFIGYCVSVLDQHKTLVCWTIVALCFVEIYLILRREWHRMKAADLREALLREEFNRYERHLPRPPYFL